LQCRAPRRDHGGRVRGLEPPLEAVLYTVTGIVLYLVADRLVVLIERRAGRVLEHRTLLFFVLLLTLALVTFAAIRHFLPAPAAN
jgi:hypothetical protein